MDVNMGATLADYLIGGTSPPTVRNSDSKHRKTVGSGDTPTCACPVCGKLFKQNWLVARHMLIHTGEKPFKCQACEYSSARKEHLMRHMICRHRELL